MLDRTTPPELDFFAFNCSFELFTSKKQKADNTTRRPSLQLLNRGPVAQLGRSLFRQSSTRLKRPAHMSLFDFRKKTDSKKRDSRHRSVEGSNPSGPMFILRSLQSACNDSIQMGREKKMTPLRCRYLRGFCRLCLLRFLSYPVGTAK